MRILIIGGTNFIGPPVVCQLGAMGHEVTVFHRGKTKAELPSADWQQSHPPQDISLVTALELLDYATEERILEKK